MAVDVLLVVADDALGTVLEIAITADGHLVRRAVSEADMRASLAAVRPDVLIVDTTAPFSESALLWANEHAPTTPLVLLVPSLGDWPSLAGATKILRMPFDRSELRRALASLKRTRCAPPS